MLKRIVTIPSSNLSRNCNVETVQGMSLPQNSVTLPPTCPGPAHSLVDHAVGQHAALIAQTQMPSLGQELKVPS
jgi:hypothetical protein